jgi:hypothetical protein
MSLSQYVIICKGRIDYATGADTGAKIRALSDAATNLTSHIDITQPGKLTEADIKPISDLQHELMNHAQTITMDQIEAHAVTMFGLLDALEGKFEKKHAP